MTLVDIIIVAFLLAWMVRGFFVGFSLTVTTFAGMVGGIAGAIFLSPSLAGMMKGMIDNGTVRLLVAYFLIFFIISTIFRIIGYLMRNLLKKLKMTDLDSILGALVSGVEAVLIIVVVLLLLINTSWEGAKQAVSRSTLGPVFLEAAKVLVFNMPEDIRDRIEKYTEPIGREPGNGKPGEPSPEPSPTKTDDHSFI
ncbi:MAG: hypothetical protein Kow00107_09120 [Planctomycetota bacterium]